MGLVLVEREGVRRIELLRLVGRLQAFFPQGLWADAITTKDLHDMTQMSNMHGCREIGNMRYLTSRRVHHHYGRPATLEYIKERPCI